MALVVETGAGLATAESFASVAQADLRLSNFGFTTWAALATAAKEAALRLATEAMGNAYRMRWRGYRATSVQALDWPRLYATKPDDQVSGYGGVAYYDANQIPIEVINACIDLAYKSSTGVDLAPDIDRLESKVKIGEIEVEYAPNSAAATTFRAVETKLAPLFETSGIMTKLSRT